MNEECGEVEDFSGEWLVNFAHEGPPAALRDFRHCSAAAATDLVRTQLAQPRPQPCGTLLAQSLCRAICELNFHRHYRSKATGRPMHSQCWPKRHRAASSQ